MEQDAVEEQAHREAAGITRLWHSGLVGGDNLGTYKLDWNNDLLAETWHFFLL